MLIPRPAGKRGESDALTHLKEALPCRTEESSAPSPPRLSPSSPRRPPPNDTLDTATAITSFPFSERIAITEVGTEPFDAQLAPVCTDGAAEHTIWYRFDATEEGILDLTATTKGWESAIAISPGLPVGEE